MFEQRQFCIQIDTWSNSWHFLEHEVISGALIHDATETHSRKWEDGTPGVAKKGECCSSHSS